MAVLDFDRGDKKNAWYVVISLTKDLWTSVKSPKDFKARWVGISFEAPLVKAASTQPRSNHPLRLPQCRTLIESSFPHHCRIYSQRIRTDHMHKQSGEPEDYARAVLGRRPVGDWMIHIGKEDWWYKRRRSRVSLDCHWRSRICCKEASNTWGRVVLRCRWGLNTSPLVIWGSSCSKGSWKGRGGCWTYLAAIARLDSVGRL